MIRPIPQQLIAGVLCLCITVLAVGMPQRAHAGAWGESIAAVKMQIAIEKAMRDFEKAMIANLKTMASRMLQKRLMMLLAGGGGRGGGMIISNYQQFIYTSANQKSQVYMNNFFSTLSSGAGSHTQKMLKGSKNMVNVEVLNIAGSPRTTIDRYVRGGMPNVLNVRQGGGYRAFVEGINNPYNNPFGAFLKGSQVVSSQHAVYVGSNKVMATAGQGFVGKVDPKTNIIKTPGSVVKDLTSFIEDLPNKIMAAAQSIPEVVATLAAQFLTSAIESGLNQVMQPVDQQLLNIHNQMAGMGINPMAIVSGMNSMGQPSSTSQMQGAIYDGMKWEAGGFSGTIGDNRTTDQRMRDSLTQQAAGYLANPGGSSQSAMFTQQTVQNMNSGSTNTQVPTLPLNSYESWQSRTAAQDQAIYGADGSGRPSSSPGFFQRVGTGVRDTFSAAGNAAINTYNRIFH